ncbi:MAG: hypothetical protein M3220_03745 [Chloroflexota bacterium]|nr:hypothetical protein [Chloroflexota bacterium]
MSSIVDLGGSWWLGRVPQQPLNFRGDDRARSSEWLAATVPGNVHAALMRAGQLPDLYVGDNITQAGWVDGYDWWLEREFALALQPGERAFLHFDGIDYLATLWLDDHLLAHHEGAFSRHTVEITPYLISGGTLETHRIAARLWGADAWPEPEWRWWERLLAPITRLVQPGKASIRPYHPRLRLLRPPMQAGWDFAPTLPAIGLWEGVWVEVSGPVAVRGLEIGEWSVERGAGSGERNGSGSGQREAEGVGAGMGDCPGRTSTTVTAQTTITLIVDAAEAQEVVVSLTWDPHNFDGTGGEVTVERFLDEGTNDVTFPLTIPEAHLWHPWEQGDPNLYDLTVRILDNAPRSPLPALRTRTGIRVLTLNKMQLTVNEQPFFARGVNWVPCDILPGTVARERYETLLGMARERGVNFVRVWGGGGRERRDFYEVCDELGLVVWQEFPFACVFLDHLPRDDAFLSIAEREATAMVRELRHHPSIALWCAGNEYSYHRNRPLVDTLEEVVQTEDTRPFLHPSPGTGDRHNWHVWHGYAPLHTYLAETAPFLSEFGLQAPPVRASLERFLPPDALWPPNELWELHHAELAKLYRYTERPQREGFFGVAQASPLPFLDLDAFLEASQIAQALGVQLAVEQMRRRKAGGAGGVAIWQWNEPWPAISWALIDYYSIPKKAAEGLRHWYNPLLLSLEFDWEQALIPRSIWAINDLATEFPDCEARLLQHDRCLWSAALTLPAHSARRVAELALPQFDLQSPLCLELWQDNVLLAQNEYSLHLPGPQRTSLRRTLYRTIAEWVMQW